jgi:hypothetical protein
MEWLRTFLTDLIDWLVLRRGGAHPSLQRKISSLFPFTEICAMLRFSNPAPRTPQRKGNAEMSETVPEAARPRLNPYTKALRRERIFARLRLGWPFAEIAREERVSERRVRKIVSDALKRQTVDDAPDHALLQLFRLEGAQALAAEAIHAGDLQAIAPYLKVLERLDRYHKAGATKPVYDDAARERLLAKMSRVVDRLQARAGKAPGLAAADPSGEGAEPPSSAYAG